VILFEGRDAAGKGGTIKRFMEHLNPRGARVVALEKPSERNAASGTSSATSSTCRPPARSCCSTAPGTTAPASSASWASARRRVPRVHAPGPEFERNLVRSGIHLFKFWFSVSRDEQRRRFKERESHPLKQWKLSPIDLASLDKWDDYTKAKEAMFFYTDTADAPWTVIKSDCKKRARLNAMRYVLHRCPTPTRTSRRSARSIRCWSVAPTSSTSAARKTTCRCFKQEGAAMAPRANRAPCARYGAAMRRAGVRSSGELEQCSPTSGARPLQA
jgi:hypothetical protein